MGDVDTRLTTGQHCLYITLYVDGMQANATLFFSQRPLLALSLLITCLFTQFYTGPYSLSFMVQISMCLGHKELLISIEYHSVVSAFSPIHQIDNTYLTDRHRRLFCLAHAITKSTNTYSILFSNIK
jgi:hypothetical protein